MIAQNKLLTSAFQLLTFVGLLLMGSAVMHLYISMAKMSSRTIDTFDMMIGYVLMTAIPLLRGETMEDLFIAGIVSYFIGAIGLLVTSKARQRRQWLVLTVLVSWLIITSCISQAFYSNFQHLLFSFGVAYFVIVSIALIVACVYIGKLDILNDASDRVITGVKVISIVGLCATLTSSFVGGFVSASALPGWVWKETGLRL